MREGTKDLLLHGARNDRLFDLWSLTHVAWGILLGWLVHPFIALLVLILWEPFEIFVLHPLVLKWTGKVFGYESWRNSMSDIVFDAVGVAIGHYLLTAFVEPPFKLFA